MKLLQLHHQQRWSELDPVNYSRYDRLLLLLEVRRHLELDDAVVGQNDAEHERHTVARTFRCRADDGRHGRRHTALPPIDELTDNLFAKILKIEQGLNSSQCVICNL